MSHLTEELADHQPFSEDTDMSYEYDEGDWGGWDTDTADDQGNLPGQD